MNNRIEQILNSRRIDNSLGSAAATDLDASERNRAEMFLALHVQNHNRLSAFVHTLVPSWQDAEEIVQDTLVVLWRKFDEFDPGTSFFSWAARVAQYEVLNYRRKNRHREMILADEVLEAIATTALERMDDVDLQRAELEYCIKKLSDRERELLGLRYTNGGNVQTAAAALNRTTGHVQRMLRNIRAGLLRCIHLRLSEQGT